MIPTLRFFCEDDLELVNILFSAHPVDTDVKAMSSIESCAVSV